MRRPGAITLRVPLVDDALPRARVVEALADVRAAMFRAYGLGYHVAPLDQVPMRFLLTEAVVEIKVTVETPDGGRNLIAEVERRQRLLELMHTATMQERKPA